MQTYFADLLAFFGISGAPQTFAELTLPFRQLIFGARLAGTEVKRGWRFSPCSKYYPGGVEICGAEKILPDLYFCDGQAIMSMKLTEGST